MKIKKNQLLIALIITGTFAFQGCKKNEDEREPPSIKFKTGGIYTSTDITLTKDTTVFVGVTVTKTEDDLRTINYSYAYDGATTTTTVSTETVSGAEQNGFSRDFSIHVRNTAGTEKHVFTTTDKDGNVASKSLIFTVQ